MHVPLLFPRAWFLALLNKAKDLECSYRDSKAFQIKALPSLLSTEITGCLSCPFPSLCHPPQSPAPVSLQPLLPQMPGHLSPDLKEAGRSQSLLHSVQTCSAGPLPLLPGCLCEIYGTAVINRAASTRPLSAANSPPSLLPALVAWTPSCQLCIAPVIYLGDLG